MLKKAGLIFLIAGLASCLASAAKAASYDFYVDASNDGFEDGTIDHPFNTISEALTAAKKNNQENRKIFVKNGTYEERIDLEESVKLYGENKNKTVIKGSGNYAVRMKNNSSIEKVSVQGGSAGILVESKARATIKNCVISKTKSRAIDINDDKASKKREVEVINCEIKDNKGKGIYIQHGRTVKIKGNTISKNNGEGIDVYSKAQYAGINGLISKNKIFENNESGIEIVAGKSNLKIKNNKITDNKSSGISSQFLNQTKKGSTIRIMNNTIAGNSQFGVNCENMRDAKAPQGFWGNTLKFIANTLRSNPKGEIRPVCLN